jgi:FKBP-type peptidyl-prolyl cis-trans isomerase 2
MAERSPSIWVVTLCVLVIVVVAGVGGGYLYLVNHKPASPGPRTVGLGDNVTVNYIGLFGSGPEQGRVFDTSILSDARNNLSWPKSLEYTFRSNLSQYTPLGVHVAPHTPSAGYTRNGVTFGGVVTGFWRGLLGLPGNVSRPITIPPVEGYGAANASCFVTAPLVEHLPVVVSTAAADFATAYPNVTKTPGVEFTDPTYHWTDLILSVNATSVSVENLPPLGFESKPSGWPVVVTNISAGELTLTSEINPSQAGLLLGHSKSAVCSAKQFLVSAVDAGAGTYTEDYNREVIGQTLIFIVTVVDIYP